MTQKESKEREFVKPMADIYKEMNAKTPNEALAKYFDHRGEKHDFSTQSVWGTRESQVARYRVICEELRYLLTQSSEDDFCIVDFGCGNGDLYSFMIQKEVMWPTCSYIGIDISPKMIEFCRKRFPANSYRHRSFIVGDESVITELDIQPKKKVVFIFSGVFAILREQIEMELYFTSIMNKIMSYNANIADVVIANFLSVKNPNAKEDPNHVYFKPSFFTEFHELMSHEVKFRLRHDYLPHDFTVVFEI